VGSRILYYIGRVARVAIFYTVHLISLVLFKLSWLFDTIVCELWVRGWARIKERDSE